MNMRGWTSWPVLSSFWGLSGLSLFAVQTVTTDRPFFGFLADGVIVALVLYLVKKVSEVSGAVEGLKAEVEGIQKLISHELSRADTVHDLIHSRLERLEQFHGPVQSS